MLGRRKTAPRPLDEAFDNFDASVRRLSSATFALAAHKRFWGARVLMPSVDLFNRKQELWAHAGSLLEQYSKDGSSLTMNQMRYELDAVYVELDLIHDAALSAAPPSPEEFRAVTALMLDA